MAVAGLLGLMTAIGYYLLRRLQKLERESEARHAQELERTRTEKNELLRRVADLEEQAKRIPVLERQAGRVTVLEEQVQVLTRQLNELQTWKAQAQVAIDEKNQTIATQARDIRRLEEEKRELLDEMARVKTENATFVRALTLLGLKLKEGDQANADTSENVAGEQVSDSEVRQETQHEH